MRRRCGVLAAAALLAAAPPGGVAAQEVRTARDGPVIHGYGAVFDVPSPDLPTPVGDAYRVVFDISASPEAPGALNRDLNSVARFLNMQVGAGVPRENMHLAVVLHGPAIFDVLRAGAFGARFPGAEDRNRDLVRQLAEAGVELYMCGQSAASRGLDADELAAPVQMALSAMTARAVLARRGYHTVN